MRFTVLTIIAFTSAMLISCKGAPGRESGRHWGRIENISNEMIERLGNKRILFGHKSVGYNILKGVDEIKSRVALSERINVIELRESLYKFKETGIYHIQNGWNGFPKEKCDAFKQLLIEKAIGEKIDIAFFKFCYVDFTPETNVQEIFDYYVETIEYLKKEFPNLTIVHVTTPLKVHRWGLKSFFRNLLIGDRGNMKRCEFNSLLIHRYENQDCIYDLARIESTHPNGQRESFKRGNEVYYSLAREYTDDGGHLNELGRYNAAREFIMVLSMAEKKRGEPYS